MWRKLTLPALTILDNIVKPMVGAVEIESSSGMLPDGTNGSLALVGYNGNIWAVQARVSFHSKLPELRPAHIILITEMYSQHHWEHVTIGSTTIQGEQCELPPSNMSSISLKHFL